MTESKKLSPKHAEARDSLPPDLRSVFDDLVEDYKHFSIVRLGKQFVSYPILADLVRQGWRYSGTRTTRRRSADDNNGGSE